MTSTPIAPVIPSLRPVTGGRRTGGQAERRERRPLPLATLTARRNPAVVYRVVALDRGGRLADRAVMGAMGWTSGLNLDIAETAGCLVVHADPAGAFRTNGLGQLVLPARVRRWCGLRVGDRVLLAADPPRDEVLVVPPAALDAMLAGHRTPTRAGDQRGDRSRDRTPPAGGVLT